MFKAKVNVTLKKSVLDPQGKTIEQAIGALHYKAVKDVRAGKHFELLIESTDRRKSEEEIKSICERLLINPIIEEYSFQLEEVK